MTIFGPEIRNMGAATAGNERSLIKEGLLLIDINFGFLKIEIKSQPFYAEFKATDF
jgi:hypothetical protein